MNVTFQNTNFKADKKLLDFTQERLTKLKKLYDHLSDAIVYFKVENSKTKENKFVEIKVHVDHTQIFAEKHSNNFEAAIDEAIDALKHQLVKYKGQLDVS